MTDLPGKLAANLPVKRWLTRAAKAATMVSTCLLLVLALALSGLWWWAGTEGSLASSLRWAKGWASGPFKPLVTEHATGSLRVGGHIDRLVWQQAGLTVDASDLTLAWQPWALLSGTLKIDRISAASVLVDDQRPASSQSSAGPPDTLALPLHVVLDGFSLGQLRWIGAMGFSASGISGNYDFDGQQHALALASAQLAGGSYRGRARLSASNPLTLEARLSGTITSAIPGSKTTLPLAFEATARGPLTAMLVNAALQLRARPATGDKKPPIATPTQPNASISAQITPWGAQPIAQANASFRELDIAALWPDAPQTLLTGSASVRALSSATSTSLADQAWALQLQLLNRLAGPWDKHRLPLDGLNAMGEWRDGAVIIQSLKAQLGGGELLASGERSGPSGNPAATAAPPWKLKATLQHVNPAALYSQLAALPLNGQATLRSQGTGLAFEASVASTAKASTPATSSASQDLLRLHLRDASATGSWNAKQADGTLVLSVLRVRTDEAELSGQLEAQAAARGGKASLILTAPGLKATLQGELRPGSGKGDLSLRAEDAAQALRWLKKLPAVPLAVQTALQSHAVSGNAELAVSWQGGWLDPTVQARLNMPSIDWQHSANSTPATPPTTTTSVLKFRAVQAAFSGRLSQGQMSAQGRLEAGQRRFAMQLTADAGRLTSSTATGESTWQGLLRQLSVSVEDPALGAGAWRLATRSAVALKWTPSAAGGVFESGAGQALLVAPVSRVLPSSAASGSAATLSWQPVFWRAGELATAGKITGLPMAWIEWLAGPQMTGGAVTGDLVFDGEWDARLGDTLALKASLARSTGDITVQAEGAQGVSVRVAAGVSQARLALESLDDAVTLTLRWVSERAGSVEGQLKTRLARAGTGGANEGKGVGAWSNWQWPADAPLAGQLRAQLPRIGVWSVLAPPGWRLRGSLGANIAIAGTRDMPALTGDLQANDLALRSVADGIEFGNGRLRAKLDGTRMHISEFTLQGAGDKGSGGTLSAQGEAAWVSTAQGGQAVVQLDAKLERLRASLRSDRQVTLSGTLQARLDGSSTQFSGALKVDQARIVLPEEGTPQLGDDVIVRGSAGVAVGKKAPAQTTAATAAKPHADRSVKVAIQLDLGQDFRIQGKGIDTLMRGTLALNGDSLTDARLQGTVTTFGGQYRSYGQRLDVEQGVLRFTGAMDNPSLDILAIRPNLTQRVGVQITGTAQLPRVRLYAQPDLPDAEKLSWLIVGRASATGGAEAALLQQAAIALLGSKGGMSAGLAASLGLDELSFRGASSNASGGTTEGAVTLGKRFSRNFYAAYERSISGALGTLFVFYDLSQRFTVRAQAGQQSAVDLIFTVPYD